MYVYYNKGRAGEVLIDKGSSSKLEHSLSFADLSRKWFSAASSEEYGPSQLYIISLSHHILR